MRKILIGILILCIFFRVGWLILSHAGSYRGDYWQTYTELEQSFLSSQYRVKDAKNWIPDETMYAYAAGAYLKGVSPILLQSEQPPLGKYLLGLSILIWNNPNVIIAIFYVLFLVGSYWLSKRLSKSTIIALVAVLAITSEPLISAQLVYMPLLDIFQMTMFMYAFLLIHDGIKEQNIWKAVCAYVLVGLSMMTKVLLIPVLLYVLFTVMMFLHFRRALLRVIIIGSAGILLIFFLSYFRIYQEGYGLLDVLKIQKWILWYHRSKANHLFTIWELVFLNRWHSWWGSEAVMTDASWTVSWPLIIGSTGLYLAMRFRFILLRSSIMEQLLGLWCIGYAVLLSFGQAVSRYLLLLLPFCYMLSVAAIARLIRKNDLSDRK